MNQLPKPPYLGVAYYPEDWPEEEMERDFARMKEIGINVVRIGEFAWHRMEPKPGEFDFSFFHKGRIYDLFKGYAIGIYEGFSSEEICASVVSIDLKTLSPAHIICKTIARFFESFIHIAEICRDKNGHAVLLPKTFSGLLVHHVAGSHNAAGPAKAGNSRPLSDRIKGIIAFPEIFCSLFLRKLSHIKTFSSRLDFFFQTFVCLFHFLAEFWLFFLLFYFLCQ